MNLEKYTAPLLMLAVLSGCSTAPYPIAENFREQAKPLALWQVQADPDGTRGATVIWGGIILGAVNDTNGSAIYIMKAPLDANEKPMRNLAATGQFIATTSQALDLQTFSYCRLVTVAGTVVGVRTTTRGNIRYAYPVVDIQDVRVWPIFREDFLSYGTPGCFVGPEWWWYGGNFYPPHDDQAVFTEGNGE